MNLIQYYFLFFQHGMGKLRITDEGIRVEGRAEFLKPLYISKLQSDVVSIYINSKYILRIFITYNNNF